MKQPLVIAHSGFDGTAPNSLDTVSAAHAAGVDAVEFDIQCSVDGVPVVTHDDYVLAEDGTRLDIASVPGRSIIDGAFRVPHRIGSPPPFDKVIEACRACDLLLNLDIKDMRALPVIQETLGEVNFEGRTFVTGCRLAELREIGRPDFGVSCLVNLASPSDADAWCDEQLERDLERAVALGVQGINVEHTQLTEALVASAHRRFLSVSVWTIRRESDFERVRSLGVDSVTTMTRVGHITGRRRIDAPRPR
ncbi:MAG: glycerophosphodiester phosphodiesterase [Spirochaetales bacterium]|nr:glycerophosphodiester phosphodiesterase [Spirochaetales bacterium]